MQAPVPRVRRSGGMLVTIDRFILVFVAGVLFAHRLNAGSLEEPSLLELAAIIGKDDRITIRQKANNDPQEVARLMRDYPTRQFHCGGFVSTANVVYGNDVILLPAHALDDENCELLGAARDGSCHLTDHDGSTYAIDVKSVISGVELYKAANKECRFVERPDDPAMDAADWAVVRLTEPLKGVRPYDLRALPLSDEGMALTLVASRAANLPASPDEMNFQACRWMSTKIVGGSIQFFKTNCDGGRGMSGGALVNDNRQIVGIHIRSVPTDGRPYDVFMNYGTVTPVTDEVIRAARKVAGLSQD